ncbi:MAG TPA: RNA ligase family protein, partial [Candidatus Brocadiales bacterium]|nr:RNA ligase family protein [Candidatus Brocadiales bacterium]
MARFEMVEYPKIKRIGDPENDTILQCKALAIEEKLDGASFRFQFFEHNGEARIIHGSRERVLGPFDGNVWADNSKQFKPVIDWLGGQIKAETLNPYFVYFGEDLSHPHTVKYAKAPAFVGFDIMAIPPSGSVAEAKGGAAFLSTEAKRREWERLGLPFIEPWAVLTNPKPEELEVFLKETHYDTKMPEGIVIKNYERLNGWGRPLFAKIVNEDFKEVNKAVWKGIKRMSNVEREIAATYVTQARVAKVARKLVEAALWHGPYKMEMMPLLFKAVVHDILEEEIIIIMEKYKQFNYDFLNKECANLTAIALKNLMKGQ